MKEIDRLVEKFRLAKGDYDLMRGLRRALTVWSQKREKATDTPAYYFIRAFKMKVTKIGLDASLI
jgi:hypothetical protein